MPRPASWQGPVVAYKLGFRQKAQKSKMLAPKSVKPQVSKSMRALPPPSCVVQPAHLRLELADSLEAVAVEWDDDQRLGLMIELRHLAGIPPVVTYR